ncbi:glycosyltransferase family 2 protein [Tropicibacter naphthalenivorans]|nr:glycosyltransferase family 2 protein [Tropicibacter naphthalenivorans]
MKICALTMVYRDYWALSRWYAHHARFLGAENLYVVAHGADPKIAQICPGASVITVPRETLEGFDRVRAEMLDGFAAGLHKVYDWVIRLDADELLCVDPLVFPDLHAAFAAQDVPVVTALGFDVAEMAGDAPIKDGPVLAQRRQIAFSGHYSKAVAARRPIPFQLHGVRVALKRLESFPFHMPRGLFLAHLKYANLAAVEEGNRVRMDIASGEGTGLPGLGWKHADEDALKFYETFGGKKVFDWERSEQHAYDTLSVKPSRVERFNLVKARALKLVHRTELPARFGDQG